MLLGLDKINIMRIIMDLIKSQTNRSMCKILLLGFILFATCFSTNAYSGVYYVDNAGSPTCADASGYGSESKPWCTIPYSLTRISGGDDLYVKSGIYSGSLFISGPSGTDRKRTSILAYPGHHPKIMGSGVNTGRVRLTDVNYMNISGFEITNYNQGIRIEGSSNITIQNCTVHYIGQEAIGAIYNSSYIIIENNSIYDTKKYMYNGEGVYIGSGSAEPLDTTNNVIIRNNTIYNTGSGGNNEAIELKPGTHDCLVEANIIYESRNGDASWGAIEIDESHFDNGIGYNSNPNHIIRNNIIHDVDTAIRAGTGCSIYNNIIYNVASGYFGIYINNLWSGDSAYTRRIYHNTIDVLSDNAVSINGGPADVKNNIGPLLTNNMVTSNSYYVSKKGGNYHLESGSAPVNAGLDLTGTVQTDKDGASRLGYGLPDLGAYEFIPLLPPQSLKILP
jgi:parallel beta-helix repeat protein